MGQNAFGVKLYAKRRMAQVLQAHDFTVFGVGRHPQNFG